jgi:hypothetical protein
MSLDDPGLEWLRANYEKEEDLRETVSWVALCLEDPGCFDDRGTVIKKTKELKEKLEAFEATNPGAERLRLYAAETYRRVLESLSPKEKEAALGLLH